MQICIIVCEFIWNVFELKSSKQYHMGFSHEIFTLYFSIFILLGL